MVDDRSSFDNHSSHLDVSSSSTNLIRFRQYCLLDETSKNNQGKANQIRQLMYKVDVLNNKIAWEPSSKKRELYLTQQNLALANLSLALSK